MPGSLLTPIALLLVWSFVLLTDYSTNAVYGQMANRLNETNSTHNGTVSTSLFGSLRTTMDDNATGTSNSSTKLIIITKVNCFPPPQGLSPCYKIRPPPAADLFNMHLYMFQGLKFVDASGAFPGSDKGWSFSLTPGTQYKIRETDPPAITTAGVPNWGVDAHHFSTDCEGMISRNQTKICTVTNDVSVSLGNQHPLMGR